MNRGFGSLADLRRNPPLLHDYEKAIKRPKAFLLQVCPEASSLKFRFPQEIGTLHSTSKGYV
jgi:hypothetical protein